MIKYLKQLKKFINNKVNANNNNVVLMYSQLTLIEHGKNLAAFYSNAGKLPLGRQNVVRRWIKNGNEIARGNEFAGQAYFIADLGTTLLRLLLF